MTVPIKRFYFETARIDTTFIQDGIQKDRFRPV